MEVAQVSVIIPVYNESEYIDDILKNLNFEWIKEIIVINDGSKDDSLNKLKKYNNIIIVNHPVRLGKARALETGLKYAKGDILLLLDADLGKSVQEAEKLVNPLINQKTNMTIAIIPFYGGGFGLLRYFAKKVLKFKTGNYLKAPLSGQRAISKEILNYILPFSDGFGLELGIDIDIYKNNINYKEIECQFKHRVTGRNFSGFIHRGRQFKDILKVLIKKW